jgi:hypothetical protein
MPPDILKEDYLSSLGVSIDDTPDELWIACTPLTVSIPTFATLAVKEY